jgi:hypothetical protein
MGAALGACVISARPAAAQSTIFNIPSTDTVAPGKVYGEFDYWLQLPKPDAGQFSWITPRVIVGVTPKLEVGANFGFFNVADGGGTSTYFQPNAKYKFFANDDKGLAASAGVIGYIVDDGLDDFTQIYGNVSKKFMSGARVTFGGYVGLSVVDSSTGDQSTTGGVILGYEQPISSKVSFVADFLSGENFWGYLTPGISIVLPHSALLNIGYSIGYNELAGNGDPDYKNNALFVYYGIVFN